MKIGRNIGFHCLLKQNFDCLPQSIRRRNSLLIMVRPNGSGEGVEEASDFEDLFLFFILIQILKVMDTKAPDVIFVRNATGNVIPVNLFPVTLFQTCGA